MIVKCRDCEMSFDVPMTDAEIALWKAGTHIQNVIPNVSADLRELVISGICGSCFDALFADEDEDTEATEELAQ